MNPKNPFDSYFFKMFSFSSFLSGFMVESRVSSNSRHSYDTKLEIEQRIQRQKEINKFEFDDRINEGKDAKSG
jgi:hypothetical protein